MVIVPLLLSACGGKDPIVEVPPPPPIDKTGDDTGTGDNTGTGDSGKENDGPNHGTKTVARRCTRRPVTAGRSQKWTTV